MSLIGKVCWQPAAAAVRFLRRGRTGTAWQAYAARLAEAAAAAPPVCTLQDLIDLRRSVTLKRLSPACQGRTHSDQSTQDCSALTGK